MKMVIERKNQPPFFFWCKVKRFCFTLPEDFYLRLQETITVLIEIAYGFDFDLSHRGLILPFSL
jgi:hypothetical protein